MGENVLSKQLGSDSHLNNARATIDALAKLRSPKEVANLRGKTVRQLFGLDPPSKTVVTDSVSQKGWRNWWRTATKTIEQINEGLDFLKTKGVEPQGAEARV